MVNGFAPLDEFARDVPRSSIHSALGPLVGYLLYTYRDAAQIAELTSALLEADDTASVVVHHDSRSGPLNRFTDDPRVRIRTDPIAVQWAHWTQVQAIVETGQAMLRDRPDIDWIVLLTGQDWPVIPIRDVAPRLAALRVDACIDADPVSQWGPDGMRRYGYRWYRLPQSARHVRLLLRLLCRAVPGASYVGRYGVVDIDRVGIFSRALRRRQLLGGLEYFIVNRAAWRAIESAYDDASTARAFSRAFVPTEVFFATVLAEHGMEIGPSLRYCRFVSRRANPEWLETADLALARDARCLFARKLESGRASGFVAAAAEPESLPSPS